MSESAIAANRFGYGLNSVSAPRDPKRSLLDQLNAYQPRPSAFASAPSRAAVVSALAQTRDMIRSARKGGENEEAAIAARKEGRKEERDFYTQLVGARMNAALVSPAPFAERLVHFWANHFAVSADKATVVGLAGLLEVEAIRPHVLGNFETMLLAVERHPAMLFYLDQAQSIGPNAPAGLRITQRGNRKAGLNENLAREILELHTLGVRTGYSQSDVTEFARALTGWTVSGLARGPGARMAGLNGEDGAFTFAPNLHEPGDRQIMGRRYPAAGVAQGGSILSDLARHPATARHLATKVARHFAGDAPPPALIATLERRYLETGGDLKAVYTALINAPQAWDGTPQKFKTPWDWTVSALRALSVPQIEPQWATRTLIALGQPVWRPGSPAGFDDVTASWAGPDALFRRVEVAERLAQRFATNIDPRALAVRLFPDQLSDATATAIARAESPVQGTALLLASPEFMRR